MACYNINEINSTEQENIKKEKNFDLNKNNE